MGAGLWLLTSCRETVVQIDPNEVVELRASHDSAKVMVGRTLDVDAFPLDATGTLLVGQGVAWSSTSPTVASVDADGLIAGVAAGSAQVIAQLLGLRDTVLVTVAIPPRLVLSADSVGFVASAGGSDPAPDTVSITNGGAFDLVVTIDSITYVAGSSGWLAASVDGAVAPMNLILTPTSSGITATSTSRALVWISGVDADDSPAAVQVTLRLTAGSPATMTLNDGNNQTRTVALAVTTAPSVLVRDAFSNPAVGAVVTFAVTGGGGTVSGGAASVDAAGIARVGSWTLGTTAGANQLTASLGVLTPVVFAATGTPGSATQVVVTGGDNQSAVAGSPVGVAPTVTVRDQYGNGVQGVQVTFAVTSGGGSITGATQTSGVSGSATVGSWTLGASAGTNTLSATASGVATAAVITATGLSGSAASMFATAGNAQADTVAATLPVAYAVRVVDTNGNGVAGIPVAWTVTFGGGSITPLDTTDALGVATAIRVLGTVPGPDSATASVGGVPGSPVRFGATATVGSPALLTITAGNAQSDTVNQIVPIAPQVRVADKFNNPIQGTLVTFAVTAGGGTVSPTTAIATQANGTATVTSWRLGTTAGANRDTLSATATGASITGNPARIVASSVADVPASISIVQGNGQTVITGNNVAINPTVLVTDAFSNPVTGRTVNFTSSNGGVGSPSPSTNSSGQAATAWAAYVTSGTMQTNGTFPDTLVATVSGTPFTTSFTASAIYSFMASVNTLFNLNCTGCHGGTSGLTFSATPATSHAAVYNVGLTCDSSLNASGYRRVSPSGGVNGADVFSVLMRLIDPDLSDIGGCGLPGYSHPTYASGSAELRTIRAWIRNNAPNN
jgi:adhesin/invasin